MEDRKPHPCVLSYEYDYCFNEWVWCLDSLIKSRIGVSLPSLPDQCLRATYDLGLSPRDACWQIVADLDPDYYEF